MRALEEAKRAARQEAAASAALREHDRLLQEYARERERVLTLPISTESASNSTWDSTFSTALFLFARDVLDRVIPAELARAGASAEDGDSVDDVSKAK